MKLQANPKVSILMSVYNAEKSLLFAIKSVLLQSYENWKCIIVNNASNDSTASILNSINDSRFEIINLSEKYDESVVNQIALIRADGDYLTFLNPSDFFHPDKIKIQVSIMEQMSELMFVSSARGSYDDKYKILLFRNLNLFGIRMYDRSNPLICIPETGMLRLVEAKKFSFKNVADSNDINHFVKHYLFGKKYFIVDDVLYYKLDKRFNNVWNFIRYKYLKSKSLWITYKNSREYQHLKMYFDSVSELVKLVFLIPFRDYKKICRQKIVKENGNHVVEFNKNLLLIRKQK